MGQVLPKKQLTESDYGLWGTMELLSISDAGKWVSYHVGYESGIDTLFVKNTNSRETFAFANGYDGKFCGTSFAYRIGDVLTIQNFKNAPKIFKGVTAYEVSADGKFIAAQLSGRLIVIDKNGNRIDSIDSIKSFAWNSRRTAVAYASGSSGRFKVGNISFSHGCSKSVFADNITNEPASLVWNDNGNVVAFYGNDTISNTLYCYRLNEKKLYRMTQQETGIVIDTRENLPLRISEDGTIVFFGIRGTTPEAGLKDVEVWNGNAKNLYRNNNGKPLPAAQLLGAWWPDSGMAKAINSDAESWIMLAGNQRYALTADPARYEPRTKLFKDMDYYLANIATGDRKLLLKEQVANAVALSPDGRYISYFKDENWWVYDLKLETHTNVTYGLTVYWSNKHDDPAEELHLCGHAGWTTDGRFGLYYDLHDIWAISNDGRIRKRLTRGRENQMQYRLAMGSEKFAAKGNYSGMGSSIYDLEKPLVLAVQDTYNGGEGYKVLHPDGRNENLALGRHAITGLQKATASDAFAYMEQDFDMPPAIIFKKGISGKSKVLTQSNEQHKNYDWGKSQMIHYSNLEGRALNGALFYPANYNASRKYPMVVYIYTTVSRDVHHYVNPSLHSNIGFNVTNLTSKGYFVLLPDIAYGIGRTGHGATECVLAGVNKVVSMGLADPDKIGLYGHSFGGYETNFIVTQTHLFAAAISGSGVSDVVSHYFTVSDMNHIAENWRYENQQYRMGIPFFDNKEAYYDNSPIASANQITTPLLLWAGAKDTNVQPRQGMELYVALRGLGKKNIMLVYQDAGHFIEDNADQEDLTVRVQDWFAFFLKDSHVDWITNGIK